MIGAMQNILEQAAHRALDLTQPDGPVFSVMVHPAGIQVEGMVMKGDSVERFGHLIGWPDVNRAEFAWFENAFQWVADQLAKVE